MVACLLYDQSENPMAQTANSQPPQTLHVESKQTTSVRLRKLPTQLNTLNRFVPDLIHVSPNASDVPALRWHQQEQQKGRGSIGHALKLIQKERRNTCRVNRDRVCSGLRKSRYTRTTNWNRNLWMFVCS